MDFPFSVELVPVLAYRLPWWGAFLSIILGFVWGRYLPPIVSEIYSHLCLGYLFVTLASVLSIPNDALSLALIPNLLNSPPLEESVFMMHLVGLLGQGIWTNTQVDFTTDFIPGIFLAARYIASSTDLDWMALRALSLLLFTWLGNPLSILAAIVHGASYVLCQDFKAIERILIVNVAWILCVIAGDYIGIFLSVVAFAEWVYWYINGHP